MLQAAVLEEFPQELSFEDWESDPLKPEEDLLSTEIQEAENRIAMLRAEAKVLTLRRKQQQENAARAQVSHPNLTSRRAHPRAAFASQLRTRSPRAAEACRRGVSQGRRGGHRRDGPGDG